MVALAWREPTPTEEKRFLERVRNGEPLSDAAAAAGGKTSSAFRRHARWHPRFAREYLRALEESERPYLTLIAKLEAFAAREEGAGGPEVPS